MTTTIKLQKWKNLSISINRVVQLSAALNRRHIHEGPDTVEELFERHMAKNKESTSWLDEEEEELLNRRRLTSTRREALHLYRDILRATRFFIWPDTHGVMWRDVLRENARKEFEEARFEKDPEIVTRLLINGREAVESALEKLADKQRLRIQKDAGGNGGFGR
ncbi:hypothetical protein LINGRAHAP2_LOCUS5247 [Linum grandiflorum]